MVSRTRLNVIFGTIRHINLLSYSNILLLRKIFGLKMEAVRGVWRKVHNKKLHDLYSCPNVCKISMQGG